MTVRFFLPLLLATLLVGLPACGGSDDAPRKSEPAVNIPFDKEGTLSILQSGDTLVTVDVEMAETDSARTRGLMQRTSLPDQSGMLFLFPNEQPRSFWMANTPLALDIIFADADSQIVSVAKYTTPYSQENVRSEGPSQFVLEMPAGFADSYGVLEGDHLTWRRTD
jgi:hypothetical protein